MQKSATKYDSIIGRDIDECIRKLIFNEQTRFTVSMSNPILNGVFLEYNDENSLSCTISLAFYFAREYYTVIREFPMGKGFADLCFIPRKMYADKPAVIVELKWDKSARGALEQVKDREYVEALKEYKGNLLLVGVNYDKKTKTHTCVIEKFEK